MNLEQIQLPPGINLIRPNFDDLSDLLTPRDVLARLYHLWNSTPQVRGLAVVAPVKDKLAAYFSNN